MQYLVSKDYKDFDKLNDYTLMSNLKKVTEILEDGDMIFLENETYYGKIYIDKDNIKIYGKDNSIITYDAYHGMKKRSVDGNTQENYGTTGSATVTVRGNNFYCSNVTFENSHKKEVGEKDGQAVALKIEGENGVFVECKFISEQDTLYVDMAKKLSFERCYIEGDVDFIFGSANAYFYNCDIVAKRLNGDAYILAPSTLEENEFGIVLYECKIFTSNCKAYLSRPWFPGGNIRYPKACYINCYLDEGVIMDQIKMKDYDDLSKATLIYNGCLRGIDIWTNNKEIEKYLKNL